MPYPNNSFDPVAEVAYYNADTTTTVTSSDLEHLQADMQYWVPNLPNLFVGSAILDLGAGKAPLGTLIAERNSPRMAVSLEFVYKRLATAAAHQTRLATLNLVCGSVFELPFRDGTFDYVVANSVLHHFPNLAQAAAEIARVMRPGALYFGREPNFNNPLVRWGVFRLAGTPFFPGSHSNNEYPLRSQEIVSAFTRAGCHCEMRYFWRRVPRLHHPIWSAAIAVRIQRGQRPGSTPASAP